MTNTAIKIPLKEKIGYSLGDTASNLFFQTFLLFITYFYTDVFGLSPAAVATMFLVTRLWDAVNDPLMGMIADRTETRMGKFRPYLLWFALPFGLIGVLTFTTPDFSEAGKLIYAYITYIFMMMIYTAINVPYSALMGVISPSAAERTIVSSFRFVAAFAGGLIVQGATMPMVKYFGNGNEALGWQWAMGVLSLLAVILFLITFLTTKERVKPPAEKSSFKDDLKDLAQNGPWLLIGSTSVLYLVLNVVRNGSVMYYFKYYTGFIEFTLFGSDFSMDFETAATTYMLVGTVVTIIAAILTNWASKTFDKRNTFLGALIISSSGIAALYWLTPDQYPLMLLFTIITSLGMGVIAVLQWAMYTDTVDYSEWKTGRRATGLVMSASLFTIKMGLAIGGAILGWLLSFYDFQPNVAQSEVTLTGIRMIISFWPAGFGFVCLFIMWFYPLDNSKMVEIEKDLLQRKGKTNS